MASSLQSIFRSHFESYSKEHHLHPRELRAANAIMGCHSAALGGHVLSCPEGHESRIQYNACRHRSCPKCAERPRREWLERELPKILPCEHFHVVFTLPHVFMALWEHNRARLNQLLFDCARKALLELCADERFLGATPGILMSLHTWGRTLSHHPHVHCLVSAGGADDAGAWHASREKYLVPVKALSALFRGKMLHELKRLIMDRRLVLPIKQNREHWMQVISGQYRRHWNVSVSEPYAHGKGVTLYLARYVKGGPLAKDRALHMKAGQVSFGYTDHRDHRSKTLVLTLNEFISRVLWHAPPKGQHLVRHCGLYASSAIRHHQRSMRALNPGPIPALPSTSATHAFVRYRPSPASDCGTCKHPLQRTQSLLPAHRFGEFSIEARPSFTKPIRSTQTQAKPPSQAGPT
jgi:hypothetical protein